MHILLACDIYAMSEPPVQKTEAQRLDASIRFLADVYEQIEFFKAGAKDLPSVLAACDSIQNAAVQWGVVLRCEIDQSATRGP